VIKKLRVSGSIHYLAGVLFAFTHGKGNLSRVYIVLLINNKCLLLEESVVERITDIVKKPRVPLRERERRKKKRKKKQKKKNDVRKQKHPC